MSERPKFFPGDSVIVENYRRRPAEWESGIVHQTRTTWSGAGEPDHAYTVELRRLSPSGYHMHVTVGANGVRAR